MAYRNLSPLPTETQELLHRFSTYLYARSGLKESTIGLITGYIHRMLPKTGDDPTEQALDDYVAELRKQKVNYGNLVNGMKAIEHFMEFLGRPIRFQRPHRPRPMKKKCLSEGKTTLIIAAAKNRRERMLAMILAYSGCRNQELTNIRIQDVDLSQQTIAIIMGKGDRNRICPVTGECVEELIEYLRERKGQPEDFLFVTNRHGHQLQTQDVRKIIHLLAKRAGIPTRVWPHLFRHSLATDMLDRGASIYSIQAILGHAYVSTTMDYYLHPNPRNVKSDYQRYAPSFV